MKLALRVSDQADVDMAEIWCTIAEDNISAADDMIDAFVDTFNLLTNTLGAGRSRDVLRPGMRSRPVPPYLVFYRHSPIRVEILRVVHGSRDLPELFLRETIETFRKESAENQKLGEP